MSSTTVYYCKICSIPPEFCAFGASADRCKKTLQHENLELYTRIYEKPTEVAALTAELQEKTTLNESVVKEEAVELTEEEKKHQTRGGKALPRDESVKLDKEAQKLAKARLQLKRTDRNKRKAVTHIIGVELFGLDLKKVAKRLAGKYACGCSVVKTPSGREEIDLQGDFVDDLLDFIPKEFPEIKAKQIDVLEK